MAMDLKCLLCIVVVAAVTFGVSKAEWTVTPQDVSGEPGQDLVLDCQAAGQSLFTAGWLRLSTDEASEDTDTLTSATTVGADYVELSADATTGKYQLTLKNLSYAMEGRYVCRFSALDPPTQTAKVGVWKPATTVDITGDGQSAIEVPRPGEAISVTRTCAVGQVRPAADLTWMYSIQSDAGTNIVGELPYNFKDGSLPEDSLPASVNNNIEVVKTKVENEDGTSDTTSVLTVTYTAADDSDGKAEDNLKVEVKCKSKQVGYVDTREVESDPDTVSITSRKAYEVVTTAKPQKTDPPAKTSVTSKPADAGEVSAGGCTKGCVAGIIIAFLVLIVGVSVLVFCYCRRNKNTKKTDKNQKKKDPPPAHV